VNRRFQNVQSVAHRQTASVELITISIVTKRRIWNELFGLFYVLENFHRKFANFVAPPTDGTAKCLVRWKVHLHGSLTDGENSAQNDA